MPTARELLEQADALMRRKQETTAPRIEGADSLQGPGTDSAFAPTHGSITTGRGSAPPTVAPPPAFAAAAAARTERTDPGARASSAAALFSAMRWAAPVPPAGTATTSPVFAPPPVTSPRTIQREPIAPSVARTALPVDPTESPLFPPPGPAFAPAGHAEPDFPTLVDAVDAGVLAEHAGDDVPVLTDAIDPLSDEPILEDLDEPSIWSPTFGGATTVRAGAPSQSPAVPAAPPEPPTGRDPLGLDRPPPGFQPAPAAQWSEAEGMPAEAQPPASVPEMQPPASVAEVQPPASIAEVQPPASVAELQVPASIAEVQPSASVRETPPLADTPESPPLVSTLAEPAPVAIAAEEMPVAAEAPAKLPGDALAAPPPHAVLAPLDDARVREIAEEIGMQVLQRIDIFTDTELRTRLGERLKPVVDRVSADLVAAINEHVGELLRAYVAEAIEREIDGWRDRQS